MPADVIPFQPRKSPVVRALNDYLRRAEAGEVTGLVIATTTESGVIVGPVFGNFVGLNRRERAVVLAELSELSADLEIEPDDE